MMADRLQSVVADSGLITPGMSLVVACSGGPDSVALALVLARLSPSWGLRLHLAYVDHGWRPGEDDVRVVRSLSERYGLPRSEARWPAGASGQEAQARTRRYRFLLRVKESVGADRVALGHHLDDQAETVLLQMVRGGAGAGMAAAAGPFVRPFLSVPRVDLSAFLRAEGEVFSRDPTNEDEGFRRNMLRRSVMPKLQGMNPRAAEAFYRTALIRQAEDAYLHEEATRLFDEVVRSTPLGWSADVAALQRASVALQRRVIRRLLSEVGAPDTFDQVERFRVAGHLPSGAARHLAMDRRGDLLLIYRKEALRPLGAYGLLSSGRLIVGEPAASGLRAQTIGLVDDGRELSLRGCRPGDAMVLFPGKRVKIADMLKRSGVPRLERGRVPLLIQSGRPVWPLGIDGGPSMVPGRAAVRLDLRPDRFIVGVFGAVLK